MTVDVGTLAVGARYAPASGIQFEVVAHGEMGTTVRRVNRVMKTVHDKRTGKTHKFSAQADPYMISSASPVTPITEGSGSMDHETLAPRTTTPRRTTGSTKTRT